MNEDARMSGISREFQFLACSGATSPEILAHQIPQISDGVQVITMTAGGNDAGFSDILIDCVFGVNPESQCELLLANARNLMQSEVFRSNIESLLSAAIFKLGELGMDPNDLSEQTAMLMDGMSRVFHPTFSGHSLIANLVFYHMGAERAKMFEQQVTPVVGEILPSSCVRDPAYVDGGPIVPLVTCKPAPDVPDEYWFDTDTVRQIQDDFCGYVGDRNQTDISRSDSEDNGIGRSYSYRIYGLFNVFINVWVQNAGCQRPTLYSSERTCRALVGAVVNQCKLRRRRSLIKSALLTPFRHPRVYQKVRRVGVVQL
jgi:hypothetical protein